MIVVTVAMMVSTNTAASMGAIVAVTTGAACVGRVRRRDRRCFE